MRIALIYFSASNNTANIANFVLNKLRILEGKPQVDQIDITNYSKRQKKLDIDKYDAIFFGFPIYAWRAPKIVRDWLQTLEGKSKKCSVFFTYGGVDVGAAHYNIKQILTEQNFKLVSTAEFVCKHTYNSGGWKVMEHRPNQSDFNVVDEYVKKTYKKFINENDYSFQIENPKISERVLSKIEQQINKVIKQPSREGEECSFCRLCEDNCPTNAMNSDVGEADPETCIRCLRCFVSCPDNALKIQDLYPIFLKFQKIERFAEDESTILSKIFI